MLLHQNLRSDICHQKLLWLFSNSLVLSDILNIVITIMQKYLTSYFVKYLLTPSLDNIVAEISRCDKFVRQQLVNCN